MEKKKTKKKWREIRSAVTMMCVMAAMLSTATYAWFTLTSAPVVNGLQMTAASTGGLKISETGTDWFNAIDLNDAINNTNGITTPFELKPATLTTKEVYASGVFSGQPQFLKPVYTGFTVTGTEPMATADELKTYVATCRYYLKNEGEDTKVGIITKDQSAITDPATQIGITTENNPITEGSFVKLVTDGDQPAAGTDHTAVESVRIAFVVNGTTYVYEPNYSADAVKAGSTYALNGLGGNNVTPDVVSSWDNGQISTGIGVNATTSKGLFDIAQGATATVDMYVWFEGQDAHCVDQIMKDLIEVQIQFTAVSATP